jgi:hypothetical protein
VTDAALVLASTSRYRRELLSRLGPELFRAHHACRIELADGLGPGELAGPGDDLSALAELADGVVGVA